MFENKRNNDQEKKISEKKAIVLGKANTNYRPLAIIGILAIFLTAVCYGVLQFYKSDGGVENIAASNGFETGFVTYPVSMFSDGKARHFDYNAGDIKIRYFILKSSDGILRAAFDACDVCWPSGKGYAQQKDAMVCLNCNKRFVSVMVNEVEGGCNPAPLSRRIDAGKLIIEIGDILKGKQYFNFSGKV